VAKIRETFLNQVLFEFLKNKYFDQILVEQRKSEGLLPFFRKKSQKFEKNLDF
jgi:hypothetical protein